MVTERLQKILSRAGVASRRRAEELIRAGAVTVNGRVAVVGDSADAASDDIRLRGVPLDRAATLTYLALNKPPGYVTSRRSTHGERTIYDLIDRTDVFPVGRLDRETSGLIFLTNDGDWANLVTHPRYRVEKEYRAVVTGSPAASRLAELRQGIELADGSTTAPAAVRTLQRAAGTTLLAVTVHEGKKRQIREMLKAIGHPVRELARVRVGPIQLGDLEPGAVRQLTEEEVEDVRDAARCVPEGASPIAEPAGGYRRAGGGRQVHRGTRPRRRA